MLLIEEGVGVVGAEDREGTENGFFFGFEVIEERAARNVCGGANVFYRDVLVAVLGDQQRGVLFDSGEGCSALLFTKI